MWIEHSATVRCSETDIIVLVVVGALLFVLCLQLIYLIISEENVCKRCKQSKKCSRKSRKECTREVQRKPRKSERSSVNSAIAIQKGNSNYYYDIIDTTDVSAYILNEFDDQKNFHYGSNNKNISPDNLAKRFSHSTKMNYHHDKNKLRVSTTAVRSDQSALLFPVFSSTGQSYLTDIINNRSVGHDYQQLITSCETSCGQASEASIAPLIPYSPRRILAREVVVGALRFDKNYANMRNARGESGNSLCSSSAGPSLFGIDEPLRIPSLTSEYVSSCQENRCQIIYNGFY